RPPASRLLLSFPTRRSSDLRDPVQKALQLRREAVDRPAAPSRAFAGLRQKVHMLAAEVCNERVDLLLLLGPKSREGATGSGGARSEEHTSELQSRFDLLCRL